MLLAYLDESQDAARYWIASLLCPASEASSLGEGLESVIAESHEIHGTPHRAELHGHELFHGKGDWLTLSGQLRARIGVYRAALEVVAAHEVYVIIRGVHVAKLKARYETPDSPHRVVLGHSLERIDEYSSKIGGVPVLAIADEVDRADLYRRDLWTFQQHSTSGYRARRLVTSSTPSISYRQRNHGSSKQQTSSPSFINAGRVISPEPVQVEMKERNG